MSKICPKCGAESGDAVKFCIQCGNPFESQNVDYEATVSMPISQNMAAAPAPQVPVEIPAATYNEMDDEATVAAFGAVPVNLTKPAEAPAPAATPAPAADTNPYAAPAAASSPYTASVADSNPYAAPAASSPYTASATDSNPYAAPAANSPYAAPATNNNPYAQQNPYGQQSPYAQQSPYGQQGAYTQPAGYNTTVQVVSEELAQVAQSALTFGILGMVFPIFVFNILAMKNASKYNNANGPKSGKVVAGRVLGIVGLVGSIFTAVYILSVVSICACAVFMDY